MIYCRLWLLCLKIILNNLKIITIYHQYKLKAIFISLLYLVKKTIGLLVFVQFVFKI